MDQNPDPHTYTKLCGNIETTVLTYDPLLMGMVQAVPAPPSRKPAPPNDPPPSNATVYNPIKDISKFTNDYSSAHNQQAYEDTDSDTNDEAEAIQNMDPCIDYAECVWSNNKYKMYDYNKFDAITGQYSIDNELQPPAKKRKLNQSEDGIDSVSTNTDRYSLQSLGFQPLAARAIIEKLDCLPKLRYSEEFHRDVTNAMQYEADILTQRLSTNKDSIQNIYPTSNGRNKNYIYTECGVNPNDEMSRNKLRAHVLSKSISTMIYTKQKQVIDTKIHKLLSDRQREQDRNQMMENAQQKSLEIARKLGFVPQFMKSNESVSNNINSDAEYDREDGEIKEMDAASKKLKAIEKSKNNMKSSPNFKAIEQAKRLLNPQVAPAPPLQKQSAFAQFECKSVLKSDGSEYDKYLGSKLCAIKKYDSNFRPMFPITNKDYTFSVVSKYGYKLLSKYGYKQGDGLGKHKQGVTTFPRLVGQHSLKGIHYAERNRKNLTLGFIHCVACDKAFCGYSNLQNHIVSKKHKKNLALKPNNLVLLCVQCQLQFPTCQKIKEHFMLVKHDDGIAGIAAFQKVLREELRQNQIKYIQNLKTKPNPYKMEKDDAKETEDKTKDEQENEENEPSIIMPPPYTAQQQQMIPLHPAHYAMYMSHQAMAAAAYQQQLQYPYGYMHYNPPAVGTAYNPHNPPAPTEIAIDHGICNDIKQKVYELGLKLPIAVPIGTWIYCPSCKSFFTTFSKFNDHYETQRHVLSMNALAENDRNKMKALLEYIKQKEQQHFTKLQ